MLSQEKRNQVENIMCEADDRISSIHSNFWKSYEDAKSKKLFELFGDTLCIKKDVSFEKSQDELTRELREIRIVDDIKGAAYPCFQDSRWHSDFTEEEGRLYDLIHNIIFSNWGLASQVIPKRYGGFSFTHPTTGKKVDVQVGAKITKLLKHFIPDTTDLNSIQTKISRVFNSKMTKGRLCLSIDPIDYLTVSTNGYGWSSCFNIYEGEYRASTLGLINSSSCIVAYLEGEREYHIGREVVPNKKWRTYLTLNHDNTIVHTGKSYPYESTSLVEQAVKMLSKLTDINYNNRGYDLPIGIDTPSFMYNDNEGVIFMKVNKAYSEDDNYIELEIARDSDCVCPNCGERLTYGEIESEDLVCSSCNQKIECECCGDFCREEDSFTMTDGSTVCNYCARHNYTECESCGEDVRVTRVIEVIDILEPVVTTTNIRYKVHTPIKKVTQYCPVCFQDSEKAGELKKKGYVTVSGFFNRGPVLETWMREESVIAFLKATKCYKEGMSLSTVNFSSIQWDFYYGRRKCLECGEAPIIDGSDYCANCEE